MTLVRHLSPSAQSLKDQITSDLSARNTTSAFSNYHTREADAVRKDKAGAQVEGGVETTSFTRQHLSKQRKSVCNSQGNVEARALNKKSDVSKNDGLKENCRQSEKRLPVSNALSRLSKLTNVERRQSAPVCRSSVKAALDTIKYQAHRASLVSRPNFAGPATRAERISNLKREQDETLERFKKFISRQDSGKTVTEITQVTEEHVEHVQECCIRVSSMEEAKSLARTLMESARQNKPPELCLQEIASDYPGCVQQPLFIKELKHPAQTVSVQSSNTSPREQSHVPVKAKEDIFYDALDTTCSPDISPQAVPPQRTGGLIKRIIKKTSGEAQPKVNVPPSEGLVKKYVSGGGEAHMPEGRSRSRNDGSKNIQRGENHDQKLAIDKKANIDMGYEKEYQNILKQDMEHNQPHTKNVVLQRKICTTQSMPSQDGCPYRTENFICLSEGELNSRTNADSGYHIVQTMSPRPVEPVMLLPEQELKSKPEPSSDPSVDYGQGLENGTKLIHPPNKGTASIKREEFSIPVKIPGEAEPHVKREEVDNAGNKTLLKEKSQDTKSLHIMETKAPSVGTVSAGPVVISEVFNTGNSTKDLKQLETSSTTTKDQSPKAKPRVTTLCSRPSTPSCPSKLTPQCETFYVNKELDKSPRGKVCESSNDGKKEALNVVTECLYMSDISEKTSEKFSSCSRGILKGKETVHARHSIAHKEARFTEYHESCCDDQAERWAFPSTLYSEGRGVALQDESKLEVNREAHVSQGLMNVVDSSHETSAISAKDIGYSSHETSTISVKDIEHTGSSTFESVILSSLRGLRSSAKQEYIVNCHEELHSKNSRIHLSNIENVTNIVSNEVEERENVELQKHSPCLSREDELHIRKLLEKDRPIFCTADVTPNPQNKLVSSEPVQSTLQKESTQIKMVAPSDGTPCKNYIENETTVSTSLKSECVNSGHKPPTNNARITGADGSKSMSEVSPPCSSQNTLHISGTDFPYDESVPAFVHRQSDSTAYLHSEVAMASNTDPGNVSTEQDDIKETIENDAQYMQAIQSNVPASGKLAHRMHAYLACASGAHDVHSTPSKDSVGLRSTTFIKHDRENVEFADGVEEPERNGQAQESLQDQTSADHGMLEISSKTAPGASLETKHITSESMPKEEIADFSNIWHTFADKEILSERSNKTFSLTNRQPDDKNSVNVEQKPTLCSYPNADGRFIANLAEQNAEDNAILNSQCQFRSATFVIQKGLGIENVPGGIQGCEINSRVFDESQTKLFTPNKRLDKERKTITEQILRRATAFQSGHISLLKPSEFKLQASKTPGDFLKERIEALQRPKSDLHKLNFASFASSALKTRASGSSSRGNSSSAPNPEDRKHSVEGTSLSASSAESTRTKSEVDLDYLISTLDLSSDSFDSLFLQNALYLKGEAAPPAVAVATKTTPTKANATARHATLTFKRRRSSSGARPARVSDLDPSPQVRRCATLDMSSGVSGAGQMERPVPAPRTVRR
ncbi:hypothetical protein EGW08_019104 [Elysia chlorotica]|uniref:Uncharacterized protein n=1 Tax=Elysia chlorotica TaxID=188477 RepID=A0A433SV04_ELYCH|nr:hypothetical protein EGW08_019104 [Elysia chlorotica]